jgi:hypothetical protein
MATAFLPDGRIEVKDGAASWHPSKGESDREKAERLRRVLTAVRLKSREHERRHGLGQGWVTLTRIVPATQGLSGPERREALYALRDLGLVEMGTWGDNGRRAVTVRPLSGPVAADAAGNGAASPTAAEINECFSPKEWRILAATRKHSRESTDGCVALTRLARATQDVAARDRREIAASLCDRGLMDMVVHRAGGRRGRATISFRPLPTASWTPR